MIKCKIDNKETWLESKPVNVQPNGWYSYRTADHSSVHSLPLPPEKLTRVKFRTNGCLYDFSGSN